MKKVIRFLAIFSVLFFAGTSFFAQDNKPSKKQRIQVGAERIEKYQKLLKNKKVALAANATSVIVHSDGTMIHDLDFLLQNRIEVTKIFAPEHGFRGNNEGGKIISNDVDPKTGVPILSLYGKYVKPSKEALDGIDVMIYDIQDVGARFYTYISTMHYIMEACAENNIPLVIFDRPNPNIDCVAGPIRDEKFKSFVSLDPIPVAYGMTAGELAKMINGQGWLKNGVKCNLTVIPVKNYTRKTRYVLPVPPSPNLPSERAVRFYPFLCLFEAAVVSEGRGTLQPFTALGYPDRSFGDYVFTPHDIPGMATNPKFNGKECYGLDLSEEPLYAEESIFTLKHFMYFAKKIGSAKEMVNQPLGLAQLWGNDKLIEQIDSGMTEEEIRSTWQEDTAQFIKDRKPYLIYN